MPMPEPRENEGKQEFLNRCMGNEIMEEEYEDSDQRYAVCNNIWEDNQKSSSKKVSDVLREIKEEENE